jgi:hypothetical protein
MIKIAIACGVVGVVFMIGFDAAITRVIGVAGLVGFIVCGVFAIANPELLGRDEAD